MRRFLAKRWRIENSREKVIVRESERTYISLSSLLRGLTRGYHRMNHIKYWVVFNLLITADPFQRYKFYTLYRFNFGLNYNKTVMIQLTCDTFITDVRKFISIIGAFILTKFTFFVSVEWSNVYKIWFRYQQFVRNSVSWNAYSHKIY